MTRTTILRFVVAAAVSMLAALSSPAPGPRVQDNELYESLSRARRTVPEAPEILLVETAPASSRNPGTSDDWVELLLTMTELGASRALILVSMVPAAGPATEESKRGIKQRVEEDFTVIQSNISALFDGIRLGSIRPKDGGRFVDKLVELVGKSGERLSAFLLAGSEDERLRIEQAQNAFGMERLEFSPINEVVEVPSRPHTIYLAERPMHTDAPLPFRRIRSDAIAEYAALDKALFNAVTDLERAGYLSSMAPASYPPVLHDHAQALRNELMLKKGDAAAWREARNAYLSSVDTMLSGKIEGKLLSGYKDMLASETLDESGKAQVALLERTVRIAFATAAGTYGKLAELRSSLASSIGDSSCIVGTAPDPDRLPSDIWRNPTEAEESARMLNAALGGHWIMVPTGWKAKVAVFLAGLATAAALASLGPLASIITGMAMVPAAFGMTAWLFIAHGVWFQPAWATLGAASAAIVSLLVHYAGIYRISIRKREPDPIRSAHGKSSHHAILAIRRTSEPDPLDGGVDSNGRDPAQALDTFLRLASKEAAARGGQLLGMEDSILLAGFSNAASACATANAVIAAAVIRGEDWRCGLDGGMCSMTRTGKTASAASGRPVVYARLLSGLAVKYGATILATGIVVREAGNGWEAKRLDVLVEKTSGAEEPFFSLTSRR